MGNALQLDFTDVDVRTREEWQQEYRELRLILLGLVAGILAGVPAQLLVEPLEVTSRGVVTYGGHPVGVFIPTVSYLAINALLVVALLLGIALGFRYVTGYYDDPTIRLTHDEDTSTAYTELHQFLQQEVAARDVTLATTNQLIECRDDDGNLVIELKFDPGQGVIYLMYNPRNEHSRFLIRRIQETFAERA